MSCYLADFKQEMAELNGTGAQSELSTSLMQPNDALASLYRERDPLLTIAKGSKLVSWGDFTEEGVLGQGSYGRAVKARWRGETVVVKQIRVDHMNEDERRDARNEVEILSKLDHPNCTRYYISFVENGTLYIVMEYCMVSHKTTPLIPETAVYIPEMRDSLGITTGHVC